VKHPADVEVWAYEQGRERPVRLGSASTIRGVRQVVRKYPSTVRVMLRGTADAIDRANGRSHIWSQTIDMVTRDVPIDYDVIKAAP
jgi:hypothetical protein